MEEKDKQNRRTVMRYSHLGLQFGLNIGVFTFLGHFIEKKYGFVPWGIIVGSLLGFFVGLYHLLKGAQQMQKELDEIDKDERN